MSFEAFIKPYLVCEYCRSGTFKYVRDHFVDESEKKRMWHNRTPWDYMRETQFQVCYLDKILMELRHTIRVYSRNSEKEVYGEVL